MQPTAWIDGDEGLQKLERHFDEKSPGQRFTRAGFSKVRRLKPASVGLKELSTCWPERSWPRQSAGPLPAGFTRMGVQLTSLEVALDKETAHVVLQPVAYAPTTAAAILVKNGAMCLMRRCLQMDDKEGAKKDVLSQLSILLLLTWSAILPDVIQRGLFGRWAWTTAFPKRMAMLGSAHGRQSDSLAQVSADATRSGRCVEAFCKAKGTGSSIRGSSLSRHLQTKQRWSVALTGATSQAV